uniref:Calcineurin-like phosphoesterase domain-containing protein n=1 Tax=Otolemur garnettii TaxID=30611 RepID=H0XPN4_OTOGA
FSSAEPTGRASRTIACDLGPFPEQKEREWKGPFYFIQGADPQFGLMKAWSTGNCDSGGDEWEQEKRLTEQAVQAINKLEPRPRFFVLCGDLIHAMPGERWLVPCGFSSSFGQKKITWGPLLDSG